MKFSGFFILFAALAVTSTNSLVYAEELHSAQEQQVEVYSSSPAFEADPDEFQSKMPEYSQRMIASEKLEGEKSDKIQVLEFSKVNEANSKQSKKELFYKCVKGHELRWMRLYYMKSGKCKTVYSKEGAAKEMSTAYSYSACENVVGNIKKNLEIAGYSCEEKILLGSLELE